jgi:hypothetical protein
VRGGTISRGGPSLGSQFAYHGAQTVVPRPNFLPSTGGRVYPGSPSAARPVAGSPLRRPVYGEPGRRRGAYAFPYGVAVPYGVSGWIGPDYPGYYDQPTDAGQTYNDQAPPPYYRDDTNGYGTGPAGPPMAPPDSYPQAYVPPSPPAVQEAVTLIFKDGRPSEQIHNYILTPQTLYVQDEHRRVIPVDQIDLASTQKANLAAGVEFQMPQARR